MTHTRRFQDPLDESPLIEGVNISVAIGVSSGEVAADELEQAVELLELRLEARDEREEIGPFLAVS